MYKSKIKKRIKKIFICIFCIFIVGASALFLFLKLWPAFGGTVSKEDQEDYKKRANNYEDGLFYNEEDFKILHKVQKGTKDAVISQKKEIPESKLSTVTPQFLENPSENDLTVTWFGHSTLLVQMHGMNILIDPIFSERSSPVSFAGAARFSQPPVKPADLPKIDVMLMSHDHYDHLDYKTILEIDEKVDTYIVPLGVENHLERWGVNTKKIHNMAWWEEIDINGLTIGCTPSRHYSGRGLTDQYKTLWASWVLKDENNQIFESGDTGFGSQFQEIHEKYGDFDLVMMDCAQYDIRWPDVHMNPEQSYEATEILNADLVQRFINNQVKLCSQRYSFISPFKRTCRNIILLNKT